MNTCANCSKPAISKCGKCQQVSYCGRECQVAHWIVHKSVCRTQNEQKILREKMYQNYIAKIHTHIAGTLIITSAHYPNRDIIVRIHENIEEFIANDFIHFAYLTVDNNLFCDKPLDISVDNDLITNPSSNAKYIFNDYFADIQIATKYSADVIKNKYPKPDIETTITFEL